MSTIINIEADGNEVPVAQKRKQDIKYVVKTILYIICLITGIVLFVSYDVNIEEEESLHILGLFLIIVWPFQLICVTNVPINHKLCLVYKKLP